MATTASRCCCWRKASTTSATMPATCSGAPRGVPPGSASAAHSGPDRCGAPGRAGTEPGCSAQEALTAAAPPGARRRLAGHLKLCSASLYFVPRSSEELITRIPFRATTSMVRCRPRARPLHHARALRLLRRPTPRPAAEQQIQCRRAVEQLAGAPQVRAAARQRGGGAGRGGRGAVLGPVHRARGDDGGRPLRAVRLAAGAQRGAGARRAGWPCRAAQTCRGGVAPGLPHPCRLCRAVAPR